MPGLDRTGPFGKGPMTGRGLGNCNYNPKAKLLGDGFRQKKQYKNRCFQHRICLMAGVIIGVCYILKTRINNNIRR